MKPKWISIKRLKMHEFDTTIRRLNAEERGWWRKLEILGELEKKATAHLIKLLSQLLATYLILTSLRDEHHLALSLFQIKATIPVAYFFAAVSFLFVVASISFNHYSVVMSLRNRHGTRLRLPGFSVEIVRLLKGHADSSLAIPLFLNSYIREKLPVSNLLSVALLVVIVAVAIPFLVFGSFVFLEQVNIVADSSFTIMERISSAFGAVAMVFASVYMLLFHIPLPTIKNQHSIRWGVLYYLGPIHEHPRLNDWLSNPND